MNIAEWTQYEAHSWSSQAARHRRISTPALSGLLRRGGDKGCSGSLGAHQRLQTRGGPRPRDGLPIWRESCHRGAVTRVRRGPPPQLLAGCPERAQQATLPACARRCGSKSQGHREEEEGAARSRKRPWTVGESWLYGSRVRLTKASASSLHVHHSSCWWGECRSPPPSPLLALSATRPDTWGAAEHPAPGLGIRGRGNAQQEAVPFLAPSFQPFSGQDRKDGPNKEKPQRVWAFSRAHGLDAIGTESIAHAKEAGTWNGTKV